MNRKVLFLIISCLYCICVIAQSYGDDFEIALKTKNMTKAEEILKAWDFANSNDPDLYIAYFNFYTVMSQNAALPIAVTGLDQKYSKQALEFITEGITRFPTRFDMRVAKVYMLGELRDYQAYTAEMIKMIDYSARIENNWKTEGFMSLDKPEEMFFEAVLDCQSFLFTQKNPLLYKDIIRLSEEMLKYYPKHVQSLLNMSTVYIEQKEYDKSIETLQKAITIEPANAVLYYNI